MNDVAPSPETKFYMAYKICSADGYRSVLYPDEESARYWVEHNDVGEYEYKCPVIVEENVLLDHMPSIYELSDYKPINGTIQ